MSKLQKLRAAMAEKGFDAVIITSEVNQRYITGFNFQDGLVLVTASRAVLITDFRYIEAAHAAVKDFEILMPNRSMITEIAEIIGENGKVVKIKLQVMELGEPDASGRRSPVPTGEQFTIPCDLVISAVGEKVDDALMAANGVNIEKKGAAFRTNVENVYAAGDCRTKAIRQVTTATADGAVAALAACRYVDSLK